MPSADRDVEPSGQVLHALIALTFAYVPLGHDAQELLPCSSLNLPNSHATHEAFGVGEDELGEGESAGS